MDGDRRHGVEFGIVYRTQQLWDLHSDCNQCSRYDQEGIVNGDRDCSGGEHFHQPNLCISANLGNAAVHRNCDRDFEHRSNMDSDRRYSFQFRFIHSSGDGR